MRVESFGESSLGPVQVLTIGAEPGPVLEVLDLGATVHRLWVTCGDGVRRNVVLGHPGPEDHLTSPAYLGSTVGRYANRIAGGRFSLDGQVVQLPTNDRGNTPARRAGRASTSGSGTSSTTATTTWSCGWSAPTATRASPAAWSPRCASRSTARAFWCCCQATSDAPTVVCLTSHAYFNLDGADTIEEHLLRVDAEEFLPVDDTGIPLRRAVRGWPARRSTCAEPAPLGDRIQDPHPQMAAAQGIDHCFVLDGAGRRRVATLDSRASRTRLELSTDQPGLQVYTGNQLDGTSPSVSGGVHQRWAGIALEPELFPDTPNGPDGRTRQCCVPGRPTRPRSSGGSALWMRTGSRRTRTDPVEVRGEHELPLEEG